MSSVLTPDTFSHLLWPQVTPSEFLGVSRTGPRATGELRSVPSTHTTPQLGHGSGPAAAVTCSCLTHCTKTYPLCSSL